MAAYSPDMWGDGSFGVHVLPNASRSAELVIEILACGAVRPSLCRPNA